MKEIMRTGIILFLICAVSAGLCGIVNSVTAPVIAENLLREREAALAVAAGEYTVGEEVAIDTADANVAYTIMDGDEAVGYYYTGNRLTQIILTLITALGSALLPRCSNLVENSKWEEFKSITRKSYLLIFALSLPASLGLIILKEPIVNIFFGQDYAESARVLAWTAPTLFLVGLTNLIGIQILYPRGKENIVIISTLVGAAVSVVLNLFLIPFLSYVGAAISTLVAEFFVLIVQLVYGKKYVPFRFIDKSCLNYVVGSVLVVVTTFVLTKVLINPWLQVVLCFFVGIAVYLIWLIKAKDSITSEIVFYVKSLVDFRSNR